MASSPSVGRALPRMLGRYALYQELASGGIGSVCLARMRGERGFSRMMAVKRLHPHHAKDAQFVTMFLDEARMAARVRHPNVVPVLDVVSADGELFLVMEYVAGESLSKLLAVVRERGGRVDPLIAVSIMSGVLEGLHAAHLASNEQGVPLHIVHRDVSPQNVLVGADGVARVVDFGIAKAVGRLQDSTQTGQIKGKLVYMPPEQFADSKLVDRRSDVWAASALLWEMLVGRQLFPEATDALRYHAGAEPIVRPSDLGAPGVLDAVVMKGLSRDTDQRYQTAREVLVAMERVVAPAPARRVAQWVQKHAREALVRRATYVEEIEAAAARTSAAVAVASTPPLTHPHMDGGPPRYDTLLSSGDAGTTRITPAQPGHHRRSLVTLLAVAIVVGGLGTATFHPAIRSRIARGRHGSQRPDQGALTTGLPPSEPPPAPAQLEPQPAAPVVPDAHVGVAPVAVKRVRPPTRLPARPTHPAASATTPPATTPLAPTGDPLDLRSRE